MSDQNSFNATHLQKMKKSLELFNDQFFWECHEELEHHWLEDRDDPVRYVYWAVIQVAASLLHYENANIVGVMGMISKAQEKFKKCHEIKIYNNFLELSLQWSHLETLTMNINPKGSIDQCRDLYLFKFTSYHNYIN